MKELDDAIAALDKEITRLTAERDLLRHAKSQVRDILERLAPTVQTKGLDEPALIPEVAARNTPGWLGDEISIPDAAEVVLGGIGRAVHVNALHRHFVSRGKNVTKQSIVSALLRYPHRFRAHGKNVYGLTKWEAPAREVAA